MNGIVTVNTDAGFYPNDKKGAYAYYIRTDGVKLTGSGLFKKECRSPQEAEYAALINALFIVLHSQKITEIKKIIINRDNIHVISKRKGHTFQTLLHRIIKDIFIKKYADANKSPQLFTKFYEFRHVKAHTKGKDAKYWVNNWCDNQCTMQLKKWKQEQKNMKHELF